MILVRRHTHYPVPGGVKASVRVSKELRIFVHIKRAVDLNHHASCIKRHAAIHTSLMELRRNKGSPQLSRIRGLNPVHRTQDGTTLSQSLAINNL